MALRGDTYPPTDFDRAAASWGFITKPATYTDALAPGPRTWTITPPLVTEAGDLLLVTPDQSKIGLYRDGRLVDQRDLFDVDIARRAGAMCAASEPHGVVDDDWPCPACLARVRNSSAVASTPSSVAPQPCAEGVDGAAGSACPAVRPRVGGSTSAESNRPPAVNEGPAEGATAIARNEGTR